MRIGELGGEFALIDRIAAGTAEGGLVSLGIGDDAAAILPPSSSERLLVTTDMLIENIHFRRKWMDPYHLGWKSVCVNLSDIAAMGGAPTATFLALALPAGITVDYVDELYRGINEACGRFGSIVAGGDTNSSPHSLVVSVTQLGTVPEEQMLRRSGARPGDRVLVTGWLGASAAGLYLLEQDGRENGEAAEPDAVRAHLMPIPRLAEARAAVATGGVTAAMDLSDGLVADLGKLCRASGVAAHIDAVNVPVAASARRVARSKRRVSDIDWALHGGEDYELLLTVAPDAVSLVSDAIQSATGTTVLEVGEITPQSGGELVTVTGNGITGKNGPGWDHFGRA